MALTLITFTAASVIKSSDHNSNMNAINAALFNITDANIAASAAIADSKLAQITTAGKVNGSAMVAETIDGVKGQFFWGLGGTQSVGTNSSFEYEATSNLTIDGVDLRAKTGNTGADLIIDINKNGTTIFSTRPQINDGSTTDNGGAVLSVTTLAAGDVLTVDVDQIGSTVPGSDVSVILKCTQKVPQ